MVPEVTQPRPTPWREGRFAWGERTYVMAILNATPDSFSGDGVAGDLDSALARLDAAVEGGADIIDVGAESTRPGHVPVTEDVEIARLMPVLRVVRGRTDLPISVDTSKAAVAEAAIAAGAAMINDVRGFTGDPDLAAVVARAGVPVVLMHDAVPDPDEDLLASVVREVARRIDRTVAAGVALDRIIIDPGFGFGKDWRQNLELLRRLGELRVLGRPILAGLSRKSTIGRVLGAPPEERVEGTIATTVLAIAGSADIVRVHDVRENVRAARMTDAVIRRIPDAPQRWPGMGGK